MLFSFQTFLSTQIVGPNVIRVYLPVLVPVRKPLTSLQNGTPTAAGMTSAGTYHQTTVGGGMKPTVVTQAKVGSKAGVTTVTTTGLTASGNATRPAVRLGTTFSNSGFKTATTNNHNQVGSLTQFYSDDFSQLRIGVNKCVFYKRTIKVCISSC